MKLLKILKNLVPQWMRNILHFFRAMYWTAYYRNPSKKLKVIGITGTDGKTSTSTILYELLKTAGYNVGLITTISAKIGEESIPTGFHVTSPSPKELQGFLQKMVDNQVEYVVLETTSHGLDQNRIAGVKFEAIAFTNVSHEHLDYHKTYDRYLLAKASLMGMLKKDGFAVINGDDQSFPKLQNIAEAKGIKYFSYGFDDKSDIYATNYFDNSTNISFSVNERAESYGVRLPLLGKYNVYNSLAAIAVARQLGATKENIVEGLANVTQLEGRWEVIIDKPFKVVVDFAHTPNALEKVLEFARQDNKDNKLIVVFGSAGERDISKRPLMGRAAAKYCDFTIITAEDPRGEDLNNIYKAVSVGLKELGKEEEKDYVSIPDRTEAIRSAIKMAQPGDTVIIAGKGHEKSMNLDGIIEEPWSDQDVTRTILSELKIINKEL